MREQHALTIWLQDEGKIGSMKKMEVKGEWGGESSLTCCELERQVESQPITINKIGIITD